MFLVAVLRHPARGTRGREDEFPVLEFPAVAGDVIVFVAGVDARGGEHLEREQFLQVGVEIEIGALLEVIAAVRSGSRIQSLKARRPRPPLRGQYAHRGL